MFETQDKNKSFLTIKILLETLHSPNDGASFEDQKYAYLKKKDTTISSPSFSHINNEEILLT